MLSVFKIYLRGNIHASNWIHWWPGIARSVCCRLFMYILLLRSPTYSSGGQSCNSCQYNQTWKFHLNTLHKAINRENENMFIYFRSLFSSWSTEKPEKSALTILACKSEVYNSEKCSSTDDAHKLKWVQSNVVNYWDPYNRFHCHETSPATES